MSDENASSRRFGERGEWWVVAQGALFVAAIVAPKKGPAWSPGWRRLGRGAGLPLVLAGVGLTRAAFRDLGENLTPLPHPKDDATLVQEGVYGIVRHPIYGGAILITLGAGFLTRNRTRILLGIVFFAFFDAKARREEAWLIEKFPTYPTYRRSVKKLIPFVY
ncbi:MAG: methyltransferase family protein [Thermomicrobiales bacterium]